MKVEKARDQLLANHDVYQYLTELADKKAQIKSSGRKVGVRTVKDASLNAIMGDVLSYLKKTPAATQDEESVTEFMKQVAKYPLEKHEKLQILNNAPTSVVHLYTLIEECDNRFSAEEIEDILGIISSTLLAGEEEEIVEEVVEETAVDIEVDEAEAE